MHGSSCSISFVLAPAVFQGKLGSVLANAALVRVVPRDKIKPPVRPGHCYVCLAAPSQLFRALVATASADKKSTAARVHGSSCFSCVRSCRQFFGVSSAASRSLPVLVVASACEKLTDLCPRLILFIAFVDAPAAFGLSSAASCSLPAMVGATPTKKKWRPGRSANAKIKFLCRRCPHFTKTRNLHRHTFLDVYSGFHTSNGRELPVPEQIVA